MSAAIQRRRRSTAACFSGLANAKRSSIRPMESRVTTAPLQSATTTPCLLAVRTVRGLGISFGPDPRRSTRWTPLLLMGTSQMSAWPSRTKIAESRAHDAATMESMSGVLSGSPIGMRDSQRALSDGSSLQAITVMLTTMTIVLQPTTLVFFRDSWRVCIEESEYNRAQELNTRSTSANVSLRRPDGTLRVRRSDYSSAA